MSIKENLSEQISDKFIRIPDKISEDMPDKMSENILNRISEDILDKIQSECQIE